MARLRVLPLPVDRVGDLAVTPFALILDDAAGMELSDLTETVDGLKAATGARGVLVFDVPIDLG